MSPRSTRAAPATAAAPESTPKRRASARVAGAALKKQKYDSETTDKSVKSTTKKSKYFQKDDAEKPKRRATSSKKPKNEYESEDGDLDTSETDSDFWQPEESTTVGKDAVKQAAKDFAQKRGTKSGPSESLKQELWREGVKTGLGPGKEVFIAKPRARDAGDVPYNDDTLHPHTMLFLADLAKNNERQWLKGKVTIREPPVSTCVSVGFTDIALAVAHDPDYRTSKKDWETFVESLTEKITEKDSTIPELPAKDLVFRIHRDIRFSKNPTPYKTHFSAAWSRTGKKGPYAAYYVHCQPGASFVGSGLWNPEADKLALLREDIDHNSQALKAVLREEGMRRGFFGGIPDDEDKAVKAFVSHNSESALKTKPKGYDYDNENIQLLRLRSFTIGKRLPDADLLCADAQEKIAALIGIMEPFVTYLNSVVMPDPAGQDSLASDTSEDD